MITLSSIPTVILARDPLPITFTTDNYLETAGVKATGYITFLRLGALSDEISITYGDTTYVFTCSATPDDLGLTFLPGNSQTIDNYVQNVILPMLQQHYGLTRIFRFYHSSTADRIYYETLEEGNIAPFSIVDTPGDLLTPVYAAPFGVDAVYRENFKINYQIIDSLTDQPLSNVESLEPNSDGEITVDIHEFLEGLASNTYHLDTNWSLKLLPNDSKKIYIRYWESYGITTPVINKMGKTSDFYVLESATSWEEQARLNENSQWWYNNQLISKSFLTKLPTERNILPGQEILLKWLHLLNNTSIILNIRKMKTVNGSPVYTYLSDNITASQYQLIQLTVSPTFWQMPDDIEAFQVWLTNNLGTRISEIRTFYIDRNYYPSVRYFFFRNSLGGFDTIQGLGDSEMEEEYKRERATRQMPSRFTITDRETKVVSVESQLMCKANLGFMNLQGEGRERWANGIRQLYSSLEAYEIINGELFPIDILTDKQKLMDDNNYLPDFFIMEYTRAFVEKGAPSNIPQLTGAYSEQYNDTYEGGFPEIP